MSVKFVRRVKLAVAATVVATAGTLAFPHAAQAADIIVYTADFSGMASFFSNLDPGQEALKVVDSADDGRPVVGQVFVKQPDGSWDRKMWARASGMGDLAEAFHGINEGRQVRVRACLERPNGTLYACNERQTIA